MGRPAYPKASDLGVPSLSKAVCFFVHCIRILIPAVFAALSPHGIFVRRTAFKGVNQRLMEAFRLFDLSPTNCVHVRSVLDCL